MTAAGRHHARRARKAKSRTAKLKKVWAKGTGSGHETIVNAPKSLFAK